MSKQEFLEQLRRGLSGLPREDIEERLKFYSEMLEDRMEEGLSEEEAKQRKSAAFMEKALDGKIIMLDKFTWQ